MNGARVRGQRRGPATRRIPITIQPQGVDDVEVSAIGVVVGGTMVVGASLGVVVGGTVVVGASVGRVVWAGPSSSERGGSMRAGPSSSEPRWGGLSSAGPTEGLLVGVDGDPIVVLGRLAGGFVDPEPPACTESQRRQGEDENSQAVTPRRLRPGCFEGCGRGVALSGAPRWFSIMFFYAVSPARNSPKSSLTSLGRSCCVQWPQPSRTTAFVRLGIENRRSFPTSSVMPGQL